MKLPELVVLLDDNGNPTGQAPKTEAHGPDIPLHLAFRVTSSTLRAKCW